MGFYEFILAFAVAGAALATVFALRRGWSRPNVLGLTLPLLGIAGLAGAFAFLSGPNALLVGAGFVIPTLWVSFLRSRTMFATPRGPIARPTRVDGDDATEVLVRETDLADAAEEQRARRSRMLRRAVAPTVLFVGAGALLGSWPLALMGVGILVASDLINRFVVDPAGRGQGLPRARRLRLRSARPQSLPGGMGPGDDEL